MLINSVIDTRDKTIITLLAKTGMRRGELLALDIDDINLGEMTITPKPTAKRSNRVLFFGDEAAAILKRWLNARELSNMQKSSALFITRNGKRLHRVRVDEIVKMRRYELDCTNPDLINLRIISAHIAVATGSLLT